MAKVILLLLSCALLIDLVYSGQWLGAVGALVAIFCFGNLIATQHEEHPGPEPSLKWVSKMLEKDKFTQ